MVSTLEVRREHFARWVQRQLAHAKESRGWSVPKVAEAAGIGNATVYRWRDGSWRKGPLPEQIVAFCDALDLPPSDAFAILWPGKEDEPAPVEPAPIDPDVRIILRRLADPNVGEAEKSSIRATLRYLADVADRSATDRRRQAS